MMALSRSLVLAEFVSLFLCASSATDLLCGDVKGAMYSHYLIIDEVYDSPRAVSAYSACHGMQVTCCGPQLEKKAIPMVQSSFLDQLQSVLDEVFGTTCGRIGRHFNRGLFEMLSNAKEILSKQVREVFRVESDDHWSPFDHLFDFLQEFQYIQNFYMLNQTTVRTIKQLVSFAIENHKDAEKINGTHVENHFISVWSKKVDKSMLGYLYYLRNMEQSLRAANDVLQQTREHKFLVSATCTNALMRKYHCGLCSGHTTSTPCDGNCINTLRGCFADIAEVRPLLKDYSDQLRKFAMLSMSDFHPVAFIEGALMDYVSLAHHIMESDLMRISQQDTSLPTEATARKVLPPGQTRLNFSESNEYHHHLHDALNKELECMSKTSDGLLEIPERMCGINPKHLDYIRNTECWNGTAQGSYQGALVGHMIKDQLHNPSFTKDEQQVLVHRGLDYLPQISKLKDSITEMNKYIQLYDCLASNDEDCGVTVHSVCSHKPHEEGVEPIIPTEFTLPAVTEPTDELGSGSGYQSANYAYSGDGDNEETTAPAVTEEFEIYDPVTQTCDHVFVVKMIPPFIRDSQNDIQTTDKPTSISPTESKFLSSIAESISPSMSTTHTPLEPSNQNFPEYLPNDTTNPAETEDDNNSDEEDIIILDSASNSEFIQNNPSGSSSSYLSSTASLILASITLCTLLQLPTL